MSLDKVQIHQISLEKIQISETNLPIARRYSLKISSYIIDDTSNSKYFDWIIPLSKYKFQVIII